MLPGSHRALATALLFTAPLVGCTVTKQPEPRPSASADAPAVHPQPDQQEPPGCAVIRRAWEARLQELAGSERSCRADEDCTCYGGPICPNALVRTCPGPVHVDIASALAPFGEQWRDQGCAILWSPFGCNARCVNGACVSEEEQPMSPPGR